MAGNKRKILIVEDDETIGTMYKAQLEADGYAVETAANGGDALKLGTSGRFGLILLDVILPQLDGFSLLQKFRADNKLKKTPIIMLTNLGTNEDREKGEKYGASDYLIKANLTPEQISLKVKKHLNL